MGRRICAWCGEYMGEAPKVNGDTHGICKKCYRKERRKEKNNRKKKNKATQKKGN